ncbi:TIGR03808 family TAT-translocated repetitive protein [Peteryoungia desertarenae]|uniref:TIGR03808 family TAT-translocated repetitive protein n=1 Tax=Peteryoungia desertarenae TaxID=1813451 RepID=A0ABX6QN73_9HYPH|nr:TIGR03808 family TAT-translocated repetitive protein [Peteryoungia desertarenae]QLF69751.1 TIGR03808 family TAT-translocated repetitive protein [Peteryoungia desertarenae]
MPTRRTLLTTIAGTSLGLALPRIPSAQTLADGPLRGGLDAGDAGILPDRSDDQSDALQQLITRAASIRQPVFLPPGRYEVSSLDLPDGSRLSGVPGATRLVHRGTDPLLSARDCRHVALSGLTLEGGGQGLAEDAGGLLSFRNVETLVLDECEILGSAKNGIHLERCGGRIDTCRISGASRAGVLSLEGKALTIRDNHVSDCGNGGILIHRWTSGDDGAMVTGNRIERIAALDGGTGQHGNGINIYLADNVLVADNHIRDCAFSALRANSASNIVMRGNTCLNSGETAIYAEFAFQGAIISDNLVDGAANGILVVNLDVGGRLATVSGNLLRNLTLTAPYEHTGAGFGFGIAAEADTVITGNVIETAATYGLMLGWGPYLQDVVASGNIIRKVPVGIAVSVVEGSGKTLIAGNLISEAPQGAIVGYRWREKVTDDLIGGSKAYPHLTLADNRSR